MWEKIHTGKDGYGGKLKLNICKYNGIVYNGMDRKRKKCYQHQQNGVTISNRAYTQYQQEQRIL